MSQNPCLFYMHKGFRNILIKKHLFYVEQAQNRLLSQFDNIEDEAEKAAENFLDQISQNFDPERHNPDHGYEEAYNRAEELFLLLSDMRMQTRLNLTAGMFHQWDKELRSWLVDEIKHWNNGGVLVSEIWSAVFSRIADFLESWGWDFRSTDYFKTLDACRHVVNVYKHGDGKSLEILKKDFPEYFDDPLNGSAGKRYLDHTHLKVTNDQFWAFSDAIVKFWKNVPERGHFFAHKPKWVDNALEKDGFTL